MKQSLEEILHSSVKEKMQAVETIWNSIEEQDIPVTDIEKEIANERYEKHLLHPDDSIDWNEARQKLIAKYGL